MPLNDHFEGMLLHTDVCHRQLGSFLDGHVYALRRERLALLLIDLGPKGHWLMKRSIKRYKKVLFFLLFMGGPNWVWGGFGFNMQSNKISGMLSHAFIHIEEGHGASSRSLCQLCSPQAGVRQLRKLLDKVSRKVALSMVRKKEEAGRRTEKMTSQMMASNYSERNERG